MSQLLCSKKKQAIYSEYWFDMWLLINKFLLMSVLTLDWYLGKLRFKCTGSCESLLVTSNQSVSFCPTYFFLKKRKDLNLRFFFKTSLVLRLSLAPSNYNTVFSLGYYFFTSLFCYSHLNHSFINDWVISY